MSVPQVIAEIMRGAGPLDTAGDYYLSVPGDTSGSATTPDVAALDITGDIDIRLDATLALWAAPATTGMELVGKFNAGANQRSWLLWIDANRRLVLRWSTNGTAGGELDAVSTQPIPIAASRLTVRVTLDVNDGAGNRVATFYTGPSVAGPWTLLSEVTAAGTTSIHSGTATLGIGDVPGSGFAIFTGRVHALEVRSGIAGTAVANPDFASQDPGDTSFIDAAGRTWTINTPAELVGFDWEPIPDEVTDTGTRQRLKSLSWDVGRTNEMERFPAATASASFRSNDRLLDPDYAAGDYFGDLLPQVPMRFRSEDPDADLFYGFPISGWQQGYDKPFAATSSIEMVDLLGVIQDSPLPESAYDAVVISSLPDAFWKLDERDGAQMFDSSGNGHHGARHNGEAADSLVFGGDGAFTAPHVGDNRGQFIGEGLPTGPPCTIEAWVKTPRDATAVKAFVVAQRDNSLTSYLFFGISPSTDGSPNGEALVGFANLGGNYRARGSTRIDDNRVHHVVLVIDGNLAANIQLYVDGQLETKTLVSGTSGGSWTSHIWWTVGNFADNGFGDYGLDGTIDEVAIYDRALTDDEIAEHYEAGTTAFDGDTSGERIDRVLDIIGVPDSLRDIATGDTAVGPATYEGDTAGSYLNKIIESEQGALYVDHPGGGKLKFRGRYHRLTEERSTTSQATFSDNDDDDAWCYRDEIAPEPNSRDTIVNTAIVDWRGGTETVTDESSRQRYGPRTRQLTTEAPTPEAARSAGAWFTTRYSEPQTRIRSLPLTPGGGQDGLDAVVVGQEVGDRITVRRHPVNVGAPAVNDLWVEGIHNEMDSDQNWLASYSTSNADDDGGVWRWDVSTWGETTRWG